MTLRQRSSRPAEIAQARRLASLSRKLGEEEIEYLHPSLEPILKETFGVITYQEQVQQIAKDLAGYSLGKADILRRAMGKKDKKEMAS